MLSLTRTYTLDALDQIKSKNSRETPKYYNYCNYNTYMSYNNEGALAEHLKKDNKLLTPDDFDRICNES